MSHPTHELPASTDAASTDAASTGAASTDAASTGAPSTDAASTGAAPSQESFQETLVQKLQLDLQESMDAQELLREKITAAASIIKRQKEEYNQLMDSMVEVPDEIIVCLKELDTEIPRQIPVQSLDVLSKLHSRLKKAQDQIHEMNHYLKVTSDGFNYEREVLEKENQILVKEKEYLQKEMENLNQELSQVKAKVGEKLQLELKEKQELQKEIQDLKRKIIDFQSKISDLENVQVDQQELEISEKITEKLKKEIERLTSHLVEVESNHQQDVLGLETVISSLKAEISEANREQKTWEESINAEKVERKAIELTLIQAQDELKRLNNENEKLRIKGKEDFKSINNLQMVLNEFQSARDSEIKLSLSLTQEKLDLALNQNHILEQKLMEAEAKLKKNESNTLDSTKLESLVGDKDHEIQKLKHDIASLQSHLSEAMRRLKSGINADIVDKKLISNLFVQFLSLPRGDSKKFEILDIISGILDLSEADKVKVGLLHDKVESPQESTFTDMWISFLYKEAGMLDKGH